MVAGGTEEEMGITYGDHLIDSGHNELTPEQEQELVDNRAGADLSEIMRQYASEPWKYDGGSWPDKMMAGAVELSRLRAENAALREVVLDYYASGYCPEHIQDKPCKENCTLIRAGALFEPRHGGRDGLRRE